MHREPIAYIECEDGTRRAVFEDFGGRQYLLDDEGEPVYGVWYIPRGECDRPIIVHPDMDF